MNSLFSLPLLLCVTAVEAVYLSSSSIVDDTDPSLCDTNIHLILYADQIDAQLVITFRPNSKLLGHFDYQTQ